MSARNIVGHHTGACFAVIPRVINNVCFNVNLRLGSNLISTEATRSNADGDWLGGTGRTRTNVRGERWRTDGRGEEEPSGGKKKNATRRRKKEERREGKKEEEDEQEEPLGIVRGRSLVTRDSCDPDDP